MKLMNELLLIGIISLASISGAAGPEKPVNTAGAKVAAVQIKDKPMTYCNPLTLPGVLRAGEPIVLIYKEDYYLFITGYRGYWVSPNMRDWSYIDAPNFPGGVPGVATDGKILYACGMNSKSLFSSTDPKGGVWTKAATLDSDRYGDADIFIDDMAASICITDGPSSFQSRWLNLTLKTDSRKRANQPFVSLAILKITDLREEEVKTLSFRSSTTAHIIPRKSHGLKARG